MERRKKEGVGLRKRGSNSPQEENECLVHYPPQQQQWEGHFRFGPSRILLLV
jgi:hypothetical protein